jgi:hypothetical protein
VINQMPQNKEKLVLGQRMRRKDLRAQLRVSVSPETYLKELVVVKRKVKPSACVLPAIVTVQ